MFDKQCQGITLLNNNQQAIDICKKIIELYSKNWIMPPKELGMIEKIEPILKKYNEKSIDVVLPFVNKLTLLQRCLENTSSNYKNKKLMEDVFTSLHADYRQLRDYNQNLADIVKKINKPKKTNKEIAELLKRGAEYKLETGGKSAIDAFSDLFIKNAFFVRELNNNILDFNEYVKELLALQQRILANKYIDTSIYFNRLLEANKTGGYSAKILLQDFCSHYKAKFYVAQYADNFIVKINSYLNFQGEKNDDFDFDYLTNLVFQLPKKQFSSFIKNNKWSKEILDVVARSIYSKGLNFLKDEDKNDVLKKLEIFINALIIIDKRPLLLELVDDTDVAETTMFLTKLYGEVINQINQPVYPRHYFNQLFLFFLANPKKYADLEKLLDFSQLVFYISMGNNDEKNPVFEMNFDRLFAWSKQNKNYNNLLLLKEIYSFIPGFDSAKNRLRHAASAIQASKGVDIQSHILTLFLNGMNAKDKGDFFRILAKSLKLHLIKNVPEWKEELSKYNRGFEAYLAILEHENKSPEVELKENLNIPYYLSENLFRNKEFKNDAKQLIVSLLFNIFSSNQVNESSDYEHKCRNLIEAIERLISFYHEDKYSAFRDKAFRCIMDGLGNYPEDTFAARIKNADFIVKNFTNFDLSHIDAILENNVKTGKNEILTVFDGVMTRKPGQSLLQWVDSSNAIGDKLYFLYCYYKYSETNFDKDFKQLNPDSFNLFYGYSGRRERTLNSIYHQNFNAGFYSNFKEEKMSFNCLMETRKDIKEYMMKSEVFSKIDIKYFQHNQVGTLAVVDYYLNSKEGTNLFMKIGTGQGKSLIIAETAKKMIEYKKAKQVFIITCYDHLSKRDYNKFSSYYKHFEIKAVYCSNKSTTEELTKAQVIYADLETYFGRLRSESYELLTGKNRNIYYPDKDNTALIMDEFDSLILDAKEMCQKVHYFSPKSHDGNDVYDENGLKSIIDPGGEFIGGFNAELNGIYSNWFASKIAEKKRDDNNCMLVSGQNSLGQNQSYARSFLGKLHEEKQVGFVQNYIDPLCFYKQFKLIVGFSGSVSQKEKVLFEKYCEPMDYYEIPPFFGIAKLDKNRTKIIEETVADELAYLQKILDDVNARKDEQPILIFADSVIKKGSQQSDFDLLKAMLKKEFSQTKDNKLLYQLAFIENEQQIYESLASIGRARQITLSTRILARGADIKVDKSIPKGLHLIITYSPENESIYTQMLGRTARQDEPGSYSFISRTEKKFRDGEEIKISRKSEALHGITQRFFQQASQTKSVRGGLSVPLLFDMLYRDMGRLEDDAYRDKISKHIDENIFKPK